MIKSISCCCLLFALCPFISAGQKDQQNISYTDLIKRVYDLQMLATPPVEGEQAGTFTSFDRNATYDSATGNYINWNANADGTGFIREEQGGLVVFEKDGPGVIWRVWSALAKEGKVKIFLDNSETPVIDRPFRELFENFDNTIPPANFTSFITTLSRGRNRYLPVPYNKHCKIIFEKGWGEYYHITYSTFPKGTALPVFTGTYSKEESIMLAKADRFLYNRGFIREERKGEKVNAVAVKLNPNSKVSPVLLKGEGAVTHFEITMSESDLKDSVKRADFLENVWLSITWDGSKQPAVMVPTGLYFGAATDVQPYRTYPIGTADGKTFYSNWYMPFSNGAKIELINKGSKGHQLILSVVHTPATSAKDLLRFHAEWNNGKLFDSINVKGRTIDWPLLVAGGKGRYCGMTLHVFNSWTDPKEIPQTWWYGQWDKKTIDWWWGEGDEKFFVDGEKFPSSFGTGSEDYIGYAWSAEPPFPLFDGAFAAQPQAPITGKGHTIVSRFQIADNVPFFKRFEGVLEKYKPNRWGDKGENICEYESVSYWYLQAK
ncbi:MAG: DUF2961 domain-containing protein [Ferruginibacter sp.]